MKPDHTCDFDSPVIRIGRGASDIEKLLMRDLGALIQATRSEPRLLAQPVYIVVTSRSLRDHLSALLVDKYGRSVLGVSIQTLFGLATQILEGAGEPPSRGAALFEVLVRRHASQEDELRGGLEELVDGYSAVCGTVKDFLEAGFEPVHEDALEERLSEVGFQSANEAGASRAREIVRVSTRVWQAMKQSQVEIPSQLLQRAMHCLRMDPSEALPARAVLIHGFADATGSALDFIESLVTMLGARVYLDHPRDPSIPENPDVGISFTQRFLSRLSSHAEIEEEVSNAQDPPLVSAFNAPGIQAEIREVARRILQLLKSGVSPERIGVTCRDLAPYRISLRIHFKRLGIPFSGLSTEGPSDGRSRRVQALLELLRKRSEASIDCWLDAQAGSGRYASTRDFEQGQYPGRDRVLEDLRLAFRSMGAARLSDVASLSLKDLMGGRNEFPLPVRRGLTGPEEDEGDRASPRALRRRLSGAVLRGAMDAAKSLRGRLGRWSQRGDLRAHLDDLRVLLREDLGWTMRRPAEREIEGALDTLCEENPVEFGLDYDEFVLLLGQGLSKIGPIPLGGRGGGIQVLNVMEARGRTFGALFIVGLNRDAFPRGIREDPLLPDRIRQKIETVFPDIPVKQRSFDEERFLFAQLLSSSPQVCLSWLSVDDNGKAIPASPLVERMRLADDGLEVETASDLYVHPEAGGKDEGRPAHEYATLAGLYGSRVQFEGVIPAALAEATEINGFPKGTPLEIIAGARVALLNELDPDLRTAEGRRRASSAGPYLGFVGPVQEKADLRRGELYVTTLETMAACPWQSFLRRLLRIEPVPDPLQALPNIDALLRGAAVHAVLERIVREAVNESPGRLEEALGCDPVVSRWPDNPDLQRLIGEEADRVLREAGMGLHGLTRALGAQVNPYLEAARQVDWPEKDSKVHNLGAELVGDLIIEDDDGAPRRIFFRADRVDRNEGLLVLTDYKTGRPVSSAATEKSRREHLLHGVGKGEWLQAVAYVMGAGDRPAKGRYLFLKPDTPDQLRVFPVNSEDEDLVGAFGEAARALLSGWDKGLFFPRLVEPDGKREPRRCHYCEVSEACLRGDSGARARLLAWVEGLKKREGSESDRETAFMRVWSLGVSKAVGMAI